MVRVPEETLSSLNTAGTRSASDGELEAIVVDTWRRVLSNSELGRDDDFFAAGGDSVVAVELILQISEATGRELELVTLFIYPTPRELSRALGATKS